MKTTNLIESLIIFNKYSDSAYMVGADHDVIYFYALDCEMHYDDISRLIELGWKQIIDIESGKEFTPDLYDKNESWCCYV